MKQFKYLKTTIMHQNSIPEEITSRMKSGNGCHYSVQKFCLPVYIPKIERSRYTLTIILPVTSLGVWNLVAPLEEESSLTVFENWVLGRIFGPKWDKVTGEWKTLHNGELNPSLPNDIYIYIYIYIYIHTHTHTHTLTQVDSGGICTTLGNDSMSDSKQKSS